MVRNSAGRATGDGRQATSVDELDSRVVAEKLDNGLPVLLQPMEAVPSTAVLVLAKVGSRNEQQAEAGVAHFEEHMVFKGTKTRPTTLDISAIVDGLGGEFNAFTSKDYTGFYIKTAAKDSSVAVELLADILFDSKFDQAEVDNERQVIIEEMNMYQDTPRDRVGELYDNLLYGDQPLGRDIIGTKDSLMSIQSEQLKAFNKKWYGSDNLLVSVAGSMDSSAMLSLVDTHFGGRTAGCVDALTPTTFSQDAPAMQVVQKETDQTHVVVGVRSFAAMDDRRQALSLLNIILGGNMSSRLFIEVREKRGLAYAVHSSIDSYTDVGAWSCQLGLDHSRLGEALSVVLEQMASIRDKGIDQKELDRAKSFVRGRMALSLEDPLSLNIFAAKQQLLYDKLETVDELLAKMEAVTAEQIQAVADDIFVGQGLNMTVIGPKADEEDLRRRLVL